MSHCTVCGGVAMVDMPMSDGKKCKDCGMEWHPSHPDPLALAIHLCRRQMVNGRLTNKIRVIKWYRKFKGIGLREAKQVIDDLERAFQADQLG